MASSSVSECPACVRLPPKRCASYNAASAASISAAWSCATSGAGGYAERRGDATLHEPARDDLAQPFGQRGGSRGRSARQQHGERTLAGAVGRVARTDRVGQDRADGADQVVAGRGALARVPTSRWSTSSTTRETGPCRRLTRSVLTRSVTMVARPLKPVSRSRSGEPGPCAIAFAAWRPQARSISICAWLGSLLPAGRDSSTTPRVRPSCSSGTASSAAGTAHRGRDDALAVRPQGHVVAAALGDDGRLVRARPGAGRRPLRQPEVRGGGAGELAAGGGDRQRQGVEVAGVGKPGGRAQPVTEARGLGSGGRLGPALPTDEGKGQQQQRSGLGHPRGGRGTWSRDERCRDSASARAARRCAGPSGSSRSRPFRRAGSTRRGGPGRVHGGDGGRRVAALPLLGLCDSVVPAVARLGKPVQAAPDRRRPLRRRRSA